MNQSEWFQLDDPEEAKMQAQPKKANNQIDLPLLLSTLPMEQLSPKVLKYSLLETDGAKCEKDSRLRVLCEERLPNGFLVNPDRRLDQVHVIKMASSIPILQGLQKAFYSLRQGEEAWFCISDEELLSAAEVEQGVKAPQNMYYYRIKVLEIHTPSAQRIDLTTLEGRIQQLNKFREEANALFAKQLFDPALNRYRKGINFLDKWPKHIESDSKCIKAKKEFYVIFCGNSAQCYMELGMYKEAVTILQDIVNQTRNSKYEVKNYYRLIKSLIMLKEYDQARHELTEMNHVCSLSGNEEEEFRPLISCLSVKKRKID